MLLENNACRRGDCTLLEEDTRLINYAAYKQ